MRGILLRIIIAVVVLIFVYALLFPVFRLIGINPSPDAILVIRICIAGLALIYIVWGAGIWPGPTAP